MPFVPVVNNTKTVPLTPPLRTTVIRAFVTPSTTLNSCDSNSTTESSSRMFTVVSDIFPKSAPPVGLNNSTLNERAGSTFWLSIKPILIYFITSPSANSTTPTAGI